MRPVSPRLKGVDERTAGEDQHDVMPLTVGECTTETGAPVIVTRWRFTDEERALIFGGQDLFLYIFAPLLPQMQINVGSKYHEYDE